MKRRLTAFMIMLCFVLLAKLCMPVVAEVTALTGEGFDVALSYCEGYDAPVSATITKEASAEGASLTYKEFPFTTPFGLDGKQVARAVITMGTTRDVTDGDWQAMSEWLGGIVSQAIPSAADMDAGTMAEKIVRAVNSVRREAKPDENGRVPLWDDPDVTLTKLTLEAPYYPTLKRGDRNDAVMALQEQLIVMGYLDGSADGQFGAITEGAVKEIQTQLRKREQAAIDAMAAPMPTPDPNADASAPTPEPTPAPEPATVVNGVVDLALQIRLHSDEFPFVNGTLDKGSDTAEVLRLQRRLSQLGCLVDKLDGDYGGNTRRGVRIFQHYNGLNETGIADEATQRVLFTNAAKSPPNPLMASGSAGDAVKQLQSRLILTGFMTGTPDGSYGAGTKTAVERLQKYMRTREIEALTLAAMANTQSDAFTQDEHLTQGDDVVPAPAIEVTPTIEINGVADPLLLDAFYGADFPVVPSVMRSGDTGLDVERAQRRLSQLEYLYTTPDGSFGPGTESAMRDFQKRNELPQDGIAGQQTLSVLFSNDALKALKPYMLKVSIDKQRVYAYGLDDNNEHTVLVRTMKCSTGLSSTPTPKGTYQASTSPGARWHYFKKFKCWAQYAYYIEGDIMLHSVLYGSKGGSVTSSSVRNLGSKASHGCVRLAVEDAKWIWQNCPPNTKIVVY